MTGTSEESLVDDGIAQALEEEELYQNWSFLFPHYVLAAKEDSSQGYLPPFPFPFPASRSSLSHDVSFLFSFIRWE